jgi:ABC-2 type transport system ATP-binding protein
MLLFQIQRRANLTVLAVEAEGLTKHFGVIKAVENLRFSISQGEMFFIVGPDGAGKTTTIRMLSGIIRPTAGRARILGHDLVRDNAAIKKRVGYLSQKFTLYYDLTVDENIEFFAEIHQVRNFKAQRDELLAFTRLEPFRRRLAENLSGGMRQKLALACSLIHRPDLLLLDEPTTGVDPVSRRDFWKILLRLLQSNITVVMTTPYLDEAERGSRVALMYNGKFAVVDTPQKVKSLMKGSVVELICEDIRRASQAAKKIEGITEVQAFGDRLNLVIQDMKKDFPAIRRRLQEEGIRCEKWRQVQPSLENVFISMMKDAAGGEA